MAVAAGAAWVPVDVNVVTWDSAALPNHDAGATFTVATGVFTAPVTGIYSISGAVSFEGNNTGVGGAGLIAGRRAVRQARIQNTSLGSTMVFSESQANAFGGDSNHLCMATAAVKLCGNDTLRIEVRHDATSPLALDNLSESMGSGTASIYFTAHRVA